MDVRGLRALVVLVVVGCLFVPIPASAVVAADGDTGTQQRALQQVDGEGLQLDDADEIYIDVTIHENGSATFLVDYRFPINGENASAEEWESLQDDIESNPEPYVEQEAEGWNDVLSDGENATDREMEISNFSVSTDESTAPRELGHVQYRFNWSSFAHVELNSIEVGDALSGFTLVDDTTLQLSWPESYSAYEIDPESDDRGEGSVLWNGDGTEFADDQPRVVLIEDTESAGESPESEGGPEMSWLAAGGALGALALAAVAVWWLRRDAEPGPGASETDVPTKSTAPRQAGPPAELLSNEERVLRLIEDRGGRIKQQEVVSELDWTEAKTSQVVGGLREDDEIDVFRIGRENVLALPEEDVDEE
ncbi:hypothetical protein GWG54_04635 [Natronococcus sp. JC468]|uniref:helix-turn-helix transcriptional regulator n=1 Tax=Natronococcus sp. JC468 TaxID=1961921 RepID=UPI00143C29A9|nr:hypothetical protein [Natronococcus sp. JC468]NKE35115.1 hypothetical protein [Natronococcus sp. JC468]